MIPQAYTQRDTSEAYKWLQTLPQNIRDEMKTMELVVYNYLRAKAMGTLNNFQLPNAQSKSPEFQKTLQNLKAEMDQFDFAPQQQAQTPPASPQAPQIPVSSDPTPQLQNILSAIKLDPKSRQILNEVREGLNLSSDLEVVRMSLVIAYKSIKNLLA